MPNEVSESLRSVDMDNRQAYRASAMLHEISGSVRAVGLGNRDVYTARVMRHEVFGLVYVVDMDTNIWLALCFMRYLGRYVQ